MPDSESVHFGQYEVPRRADGTLWELGKGAMGVTYRAFDTKVKVDVVLKLIHPHFLENERIQRLFLREARAAAKVRHPNIAAVINLHDEPPYYYTMEHVDGEPLSRVLKTRGPLPVAEALGYADQVAAALGALARERIVHRDLKPSNLMLLPDEDAPFGMILKVIDFGLAKGFNEAGGDTHPHLASDLSQSGIFSGTPYYASPEQCATQPGIDTRSDLYSLGVILWEMLTGQLPFSGTMGQVLAMHQFQPPPWTQVGGMPVDVVEILRRLLEKSVTARFQTPRELRDAIAACRLDGEGFIAPAAPTERAFHVTPLSDAGDSSIATDLALGSRYLLVEAFPEGDGGRLYRALDRSASEAPVAIKLLAPDCAADENFMAALRTEMGKIRAAAQPMFLTTPFELGEAESGHFVVREWAAGFSLLELLRARRAISSADLQRLLASLPEGLDSVARLGLAFTEPLLHKLFVMSNAGQWSSAQWQALRARPVGEWPAFRLRWNPLTFRASAHALVGDVTRPGEEAELQTSDPVVALARLGRELLGGRPGGSTSLPACSERANAVLRRALAPGGGRLAFASAVEFWRELFQVGTASASRIVIPAPSVGAPPTPPLAALPDPVRPARRSLSGPMIAVVGVAFVLVVGAFGVRGWMGKDERKRGAMPAVRTENRLAGRSEVATPTPDPAVLRPTPQAVVSSPAAAAVSAPRAAGAGLVEPFDNSLGMKFTPLFGSRVLFAVSQTRRSDFAVFLKETSYQPVGGAVIPGWRKSILENPDGQPVVNLTFAEARTFCAWLTQRERAAGRLTTEQTYRLPTNFEWTFGAGVDGPGAKRALLRGATGGVFDPHGPVSDWCDAPRSGGVHVMRGGSQQGVAPAAQADLRSPSVGFRVVLDDGRKIR